MGTRMLATLAQTAALVTLLLAFLVAVTYPRVEPAERLHWPSRSATTGEQITHDLEQCRALLNAGKECRTNQ